ncbi:MAG: DNA (cytosine-5-)-methyltransferase [Rhodospirillaceae bacterium]|nr:DNA (cytosine-5-)-methyltransferase [Rhodospirillaceae bacterium]
MKVAGLFSGIGGLELPFQQHGASTSMLCDIWEPSRRVLQARFPGIPIKGDIAELRSIPAGTDVVTAGFPCTDLSQAGKTAGITGKDSGLVAHVFRLLANRKVDWLVLENVRNMLVLDEGKAMSYLISRLEALKFKWAYRLVDSRFSGVPHRRHRVLFVASRHHDPREVLFADESGEPADRRLRDDVYGFYWTEGLAGLGWAQDAVPPLKGGSSIGIPSPPGIWVRDAPHGRRFVVPSIEDAEALQGFPRGWTAPSHDGSKNGPRWKLVGNAVTVGVADWLVGRLVKPGPVVVKSSPWSRLGRWPEAAFGYDGKAWQFEASYWPVKRRYRHLADVVRLDKAAPLSLRATAGFLERTGRSKLRFDEAFLADLRRHVSAMEPGITSGRKRPTVAAAAAA